MDIVRNADGTLVVPVEPERQHDTDGDADTASVGESARADAPTTRVLHPGEGGYDEALAEWDLQQNPDREPAVSTASGRQEAMALVHEVAESPDHAVAPALGDEAVFAACEDAQGTLWFGTPRGLVRWRAGASRLFTTADGLPLVTLTASNAPLGEVVERLAKKLGTTIDVSPAARNFRVTTELDEQPLDLTLRELAPQAYVDAVLTGGGAGKTTVLSIHLRSAGEAAPSLQELAKSRSDVIMFSGHTEDPGVDPLEDTLEVTYRNDRLRVFAKGQPLSVITARIAEARARAAEVRSLGCHEVAAPADVVAYVSNLDPNQK